MLKEIKLIISSNLTNISLIGMAVNKICAQIPLNKIEAYQIELCVVEAVNNVIKHAYKNETGHDVVVSIKLYLDRITFLVCDTGKAMELKQAADLEFDPADLENLPESGMGLVVIHQIMDEVAYKTIEDRNVLTMTKIFGAK